MQKSACLGDSGKLELHTLTIRLGLHRENGCAASLRRGAPRHLLEDSTKVQGGEGVFVHPSPLSSILSAESRRCLIAFATMA